jgi:hypothetical protein
MSEEIILYHHLGLGDHFVCNGLVNYLSEKNKYKIHLICKQQYFGTISSLYSDNKRIIVHPISCIDENCSNEISTVNEFSKEKNIPILRVGFDSCDPYDWDRSFYKQLDIPFDVRYSYFRLPSLVENMLPVPDENYILIHDSTRIKKYDLNIESNYHHMYVVNGLTDNMLCYLNMIYGAKEIHCVNSSFFHLVDSIKNTKSRLYYHHLRKTDQTHFNIDESKWNKVQYL